MIVVGEVVALMDYKIGLEYRAVALRPEHVAASTLSAEEIDGLIVLIERFAEAVDVRVRTRPLSPDPNDEMILDVAINGGADAIVTSNVKHFKEGARRFSIAVLTPKEFLSRRRKEDDAD